MYNRRDDDFREQSDADAYSFEPARIAELEAVLSSLQDGIIIYRGDRVAFFNKAAERIRGMPFKIGERYQDVQALIKMRDSSGKLLTADELPSARASRGEILSGFEARISSPSGEEIIVSISASPIRDPKGNVTGSVILFHDITELRNAQVKLEHSFSEEHIRREELEAMLYSAADAVFAVSIDGILGPLNPVAYGLLGEFFTPPFNVNSMDIEKHCRPKYPDTGLPVTFEDIAFQRALRERYVNYEVIVTTLKGEERAISSSGSPIFNKQNRVVGGIVFCRETTEQVQTRIKMQALLNKLTVLHELTDIITSSLNPKELAENIIAGFCQRLDIASSSIWMFDRRTVSLNLIASLGYPPGFFEIVPSIPVYAPYENARVFTTGKPLFVEDVEISPISEGTREVIRKTGIKTKSIAFLPLIARNETIGTINFCWSEVREFTPEDQDFLISITNEAAIGLDNARLFQQVESDRRNLELLNEIELNITSGLDLNTLMNRTADGIKKLIRTDAAGIVLWDEKEQKISDVFFIGIPKYVADALKSKRSVTATVIKSGKTTIVENYPAHPNAVKEFINIGLANAIVVPIISRNVTHGAIHILGLSPERKYDENDVRILEAIAKPVAVAIENARLYEAEHQVANVLQTALLTVPQAIPGVDFGYLYRSATETAQVGGDFYDIFEIEHDLVGIIVGDVAGKGIEAATLTSLVKNTIRAYAYENNSPSAVITTTNEVLVKSSPALVFTTAFFGILSLKTGHLIYCSAGHPPGIIKRADQSVELLQTNSPMVGALSGLKFVDNNTDLRDSNVLIIYTDGVIEARCNKEFFGEEMLVSFIKNLPATNPGEIPEKIFDEVLKFTKGVLSDDIAILSVGLQAPARA